MNRFFAVVFLPILVGWTYGSPVEQGPSDWKQIFSWTWAAPGSSPAPNQNISECRSGKYVSVTAASGDAVVDVYGCDSATGVHSDRTCVKEAVLPDITGAFSDVPVSTNKPYLLARARAGNGTVNFTCENVRNMTFGASGWQTTYGTGGTGSGTGTNSETWTIDEDNPGTAPADGAGFVISGGTGTDIQCLYNATTQRFECEGPAGGFYFIGPVGWAGDGDGARLELGNNYYAAPPTVTPGLAAFYSQENSAGDPLPFHERVLSCLDESDGSGNTRLCPDPAASGGTQSGGSADGYCDAFVDFGDCRLKTDKAAALTQRQESQTIQVTFSTPSVVETTASPYYGAKCPSLTSDYGNMSWCNSPNSHLVSSPGHEIRVEEITLKYAGDDLPSIKQPGDDWNCTYFLGYTMNRDDFTGCNRPGQDACTGWDFIPLVHTGAVNTPVGTPQLLDTNGESYTRRDFDDDGDTEDVDLVAHHVQIYQHHRHYCSTGTTLGAPCFTTADCGGGGTCTSQSTGPWACIEGRPMQARITYTDYDLQVEP